MNRLLLLTSTWATAWQLTLGVAVAPAADAVHYGRDIRPILADRCFACHGPDEGQREADLRLDVRESAVDLEAIRPGQAAASALIERVTTDAPDLQMPPPDAHKKPLTPAEIALLKRWIDEGAEYSGHWAYMPPARPAPPQVEGSTWSVNPIDRFVAAEHQRRGLRPAPEADRRTLVRRLSFDLLGLPPTAEQVDQFANDSSQRAYEQVVDRLLDSPHFGERMAVYWLDLVRFADTCGYHSDNHRDVAAYRDYVVDAFNNNKPFDQFTIEQLAGDLLPGSTIEQKIASGYNRLLQTTEEGGAQRKEYLAIYQADRVRNVSTVWLGTTLGCCQCHDHKYDPFTMRDFYSMGAFFADLRETVPGRQPPNLRLPTAEQQAEMKQLEQQVAAAENAPVEAEELAAWEATLRDSLAPRDTSWNIVRPRQAISSGGATLKPLDDDSLLATGKNPPQDDYTVTLPTDLSGITAIRLETLTDASLAGGGLSRANGNFVLTDFTVGVQTGGEVKPLKLASAAADFEQNGFPVAHAIDDNPQTGWAVEGWQRKQNCTALFRLAEPLAGGPGTVLVVEMKHHSPHAQHNIGRFRLALTRSARPELPRELKLPGNVVEALQAAPDKRSAAQQQALLAHFRATSPARESQRRQAAEARKRLEQLNSSVRTMLVAEATEPRMVRILPRGNWLDDSGAPVTAATPASLPPLEIDGRRANRLDLAQWIVSPENPLTARVMVKRLWYLTFGQGLSRSLEDVGHQGKWPSHPELLDWLAVEFVESGWNVKHVLKLITMSQTYRQSSRGSPEAREQDPYNEWLTRQNRFRLEAEFIRDTALKLSGLLVDDVGSGRSVKPYQPAGYWKHLNFPKRTYQADGGSNQYRRGLYTYWCRTFPHPSLVTFDAPSREECTAQRPRSNTPLQALVLLNDPTYVEAARAFAQQMLAAPVQSDAERIGWGYRQALSRPPDDAELAIVSGVYQQARQRYTADPEAAGKLLGVGQAPLPEGVDAAQLAAWTSVARVIFNLHETITRN